MKKVDVEKMSTNILERDKEGVLRWSGSRSVGRSQKRWTDTVKLCLRKRGLDVRQARRILNARSEWLEFVSGNAWSVAREMSS